MNHHAAIRRALASRAIPCLFVGGLVALSIGDVSKVCADITLADIEAKWKERQDSATTLSCEWTGTYLVVAGTESYMGANGARVRFPSSDTLLHYSYKAFFSGNDKVRFEYRGPIRIEETGSYEDCWYLSVTDGKVQHCYFDKDKSGTPRFHANGFIAGSPITVEIDSCNLRALLLIYRPFHPRLRQRLDLAHSRVLTDQGELRSRRCTIMQSRSETSRVDVWLDSLADFVPMRYQEFTSDLKVPEAWRLGFQIDIDYAQNGEGRHLPLNWQYTGYGSNSKLVFRGTGKVASCRAGLALDDSLFRFEFPLHTLVTDTDTAQSYIVLDRGSKRPVTQYEESTRVPFNRLLVTPPQYGPPRPPGRWTWLLALMLATGIIIGWFVWRRR